MPNIGFPELMIILVVVLLLFGPKKLPDFARSMGQAIREFRKASQDVMSDLHRASLDEPTPTRTTARDDDYVHDNVEQASKAAAADEKPAGEAVAAQETSATKQL